MARFFKQPEIKNLKILALLVCVVYVAFSIAFVIRHYIIRDNAPQPIVFPEDSEEVKNRINEDMDPKKRTSFSLTGSLFEIDGDYFIIASQLDGRTSMRLLDEELDEEGPPKQEKLLWIRLNEQTTYGEIRKEGDRIISRSDFYAGDRVAFSFTMDNERELSMVNITKITN